MSSIIKHKNSSQLIAQRDIGAQYNSLLKQHQQLKNRYDEVMNENKTTKGRNQTYQRELTKTRNTLEK